MVVEEHAVFRVTRNADLTLEDEDADDLLAAVEMELRRRRFGRAVRLEVQAGMSEEMLELLLRELELDADDVTAHRAPLDLTCLWQLHALDRRDLKDRPWPPVTAGRIASRRGSRPQHLLGHPRTAADGPPPVRELRQQRRVVHRPGRRRPAGAEHQDDAVPRRRRQPDRPQPDPCRRARRAGGGARRAEGAVRRGNERHLGQGAGARRRARRLRLCRPEDPRQVRARGPRRRATACAATATSAPATTTREPPGCTRTSASSHATRRSATMSPSCSTT